MSLTRIFRRPDYTSEYTQFLTELRTQKPDLLEQQKAGRALLWDRKQDREAQAEFKVARVPQAPYVYQTRG
jgi:hypothetical protein